MGFKLVIVVGVTVLLIAIILEIVLDNRHFERKEINMSEVQAIAKNKVKNAVSGEEVVMESFWAEQACVITFFRRFG